MHCRTIRDILPLYTVDGLPEARRAAVSAHLADCAACRHELEMLHQATAVFERLPVPQPPPDLWARVAAATVDRPAYHLRWWQPAIAFAALTLLLICGLSQHRPAPVTPLAAGDAMANAYAHDYRLAQVQDPLADRAGVGLLLVEDRR